MMQSPTAVTSEPMDEMSLRDYWRILVSYRRFISIVVGLVVGGMTVFVVMQQPVYVSTTTLMPLSGTRNNLSAALGELSGFVPGLGGLGKDNPTDRLLAVLQSRSLATDVVQSLHLLPILFESRWNDQTQQWRTQRPPTLQDAVRRLQTLVSITASRQGVLSIVVEHPDPVLAAAIANRHVSTLRQFLQDNAFSLAKKQRLFLAEQLDKTRQELATAEEELKQFEQTYGIVALDAQTTAAVRATAFLEEQIMAKEIQLRVQQRVTTGASQEVALLQEELRGIRAQLARLQRGLPAEQSVVAGKPLEELAWLPFSEAPAIKLRYARLQRASLVQNKLYALLAQQFEQAKIDEARDDTAFQILDRALPPDRKSRPKRALSIALAGLVAVLAGAVGAFMRHASDTTVRTPGDVEREIGLPVFAALPSLEAPALPWQGTAPSTEVQRRSNHLLDTSVTPRLQHLYTRLKYRTNGPPVQTALILGLEAPEAAQALIVNLAVVIAETGCKLLLLEANLQQPTLHAILHCALGPGLAEALHDPVQWQQSIQQTRVHNLYLVAAGTSTPTTLTRLASADFDLLLAHYKAGYDMILCIAPAPPGSHEAVILSQKADTTCFVLLGGVSHRDTVVAAKHAMEAMQAPIAGAVFIARLV